MRLAYELATEFLIANSERNRRMIREGEVEQLAELLMQYDREKNAVDCTYSSSVYSNTDEEEFLYDEL